MEGRRHCDEEFDAGVSSNTETQVPEPEIAHYESGGIATGSIENDADNERAPSFLLGRVCDGRGREINHKDTKSTKSTKSTKILFVLCSSGTRSAWERRRCAFIQVLRVLSILFPAQDFFQKQEFRSEVYLLNCCSRRRTCAAVFLSPIRSLRSRRKRNCCPSHW